MRRCSLAAVVAAGLVVALASPVRGQSFGFAWWKSDQFQKTLGLTADQTTRIDTVFQTALPDLRHGKEELDQQEARLSHMIETNADEAKVVRQVDQVEAIRAQLNKMRTLMLLHMRQVLTPDQRVKLKALHDQYENDRRATQQTHGDARP